MSLRIRVSAQGHRPDLACPVDGCDGHLVLRTNSLTGDKFYGCSNWSRTQCSANPEHGNHDFDGNDGWAFHDWRDWGDL